MASPVYDPYPSFGKYSQRGCQRGLLTEGELGLYGTDTGRRAKDKEKYDSIINNLVTHFHHS